MIKTTTAWAHTAGPWKVICTQLPFRHYQILGQDGFPLMGGKGKRIEEERQGNARLIAAAPALLAVCQKALTSEIDGSFVKSSDWWKDMKNIVDEVTNNA